MSVAKVGLIIERIKSATPDSMIAVFALPEPEGEFLNAVFESTIQTQSLKKLNGSLYVGSYHNGMGMKRVREELMGATMGVL